MSGILIFPLIAGILVAAYIVWYATKDWIKFVAFVEAIAFAAFLLLAYSPSSLPTNLQSESLSIGAVGFSGFIDEFLGEGWLSLIWLTSLVVDVVVTSTGTRLPKLERFNGVLHIIVILGFGLVLFSYLSGKPIRNAFG